MLDGTIYVTKKKLFFIKIIKMKRFTYVIVALILFSGIKVKADEGMWLPMFIDRLNYVDMQNKGLQLTPEEIYSVNNSSLKDAIVGLSDEPKPSGFFCTGEIVSSQGLMFTNHHCGFDAIQKHSTVEHDYLADGFWAMSLEEELPNEGLTASFLIRMDDVTDSILPMISDTLEGSARTAAIKEITARLKKAASEDGKYNIVVKSFFQGNEYYLFVYEVYHDVRLVGAPPSSIGKFGGDTDNWMWPRHTGDFSIFRVYTAPDGSPAEYSKDNVPMKPKHHLPVSLDGVKENDFSMIWGFPGSTERYLTAEGLNFKTENYFPPLIEVFGKKLETWKKHMNADQGVRIKYASQYAGIANGWKYFIGQKRGVKKLDVVGQKKEYEKKFQDWVDADPQRSEEYGTVLADIDAGYKVMSEGITPLIFASISGLGGSGIIGYAQEFSGFEGLMKQQKEEKDKKKKAKKEKKITKSAEGMIEAIPEHFKDYDMATDRDVFAELSKLYYEKLSPEMQPELLVSLYKKNKGDFYAIADYVFEKSMFGDAVKTEEFLKDPSLKVLDKDPAFILMKQFMANIMTASDNYKQGGATMSKAERLYVKAMQEMEPERFFYPDANSTMRFTYGQVKNYYPEDAVTYDFVTHLSGVIAKEDPNNNEFVVASKLKELYQAKDYGPYANEDGRMVVCFLSNNDITGGNSGSPVINGKGELIGLAFDGNWEAMSSDLAFAPKMQRTIVVDARYVLFIIDKFAGAGHLVDELTIHKTMPQPLRVEELPMEEVSAE
jgi:hypothetical protein